MDPAELAVHRAAEAARSLEGPQRARGPQYTHALLNADGSLRVVPRQHTLGLMDRVCGHCRGLHFAFEARETITQVISRRVHVYSSCCDKGKINPATIRLPAEFPAELLELYRIYSPDDPAVAGLRLRNNKFYRQLDLYNRDFAMASLGYKSRNAGPRVMNVEGLVYHFTHDLRELGNGRLPLHNQCWLLPTEEANAIRAIHLTTQFLTFCTAFSPNIIASCANTELLCTLLKLPTCQHTRFGSIRDHTTLELTICLRLLKSLPLSVKEILPQREGCSFTGLILVEKAATLSSTLTSWLTI
jgi:hypothetical protein